MGMMRVHARLQSPRTVGRVFKDFGADTTVKEGVESDPETGGT